MRGHYGEYYQDASSRRWWWIGGAGVLILLVAVLVIRQLTGSGQDGGASATPPAHDPPATFDTASTALPRDADADPLPAVLHGFDAFLALPDGLQVVDTRSGEVRAQLEPTGVPSGSATTSGSGSGSGSGTKPGSGSGSGTGSGSGSGGGPASGSGTETADVTLTGAAPFPPVASLLGGRPVVLAAYPVRVAGHGTTVGHDAVQLLAVDQTSYALVAGARIDLPVSLGSDSELRDAQAIGVVGTVLVATVHLGPNLTPASYGVDLSAGRLAWQLPGFSAAAISAGLVVGSLEVAADRYRVSAVGGSDGKQVWRSTAPDALTVQIWPAGAALVAVSNSDAATGSRSLTVLDARTGAVRTTEPGQSGVTCRFDERDTTVCYQAVSDQAWAAGYDSTTGRRLWQLPDPRAGRIAPTVSTAWHGAVYGTTDNGPVTLDARTGADRAVSPQLAPDLVDAYVGITAATSTHPRAAAHLATS